MACPLLVEPRSVPVLLHCGRRGQHEHDGYSADCSKQRPDAQAHACSSALLRVGCAMCGASAGMHATRDPLLRTGQSIRAGIMLIFDGASRTSNGADGTAARNVLPLITPTRLVN